MLQLDLSELKFVVFGILLAHLLLAMFQYVDFEEATCICDAHEVGHVYEIVELENFFFSRGLRTGKLQEAVRAANREDVVAEFIAETLLEELETCAIVVLKHAFP